MSFAILENTRGLDNWHEDGWSFVASNGNLDFQQEPKRIQARKVTAVKAELGDKANYAGALDGEGNTATIAAATDLYIRFKFRVNKTAGEPYFGISLEGDAGSFLRVYFNYDIPHAAWYISIRSIMIDTTNTSANPQVMTGLVEDTWYYCTVKFTETGDSTVLVGTTYDGSDITNMSTAELSTKIDSDTFGAEQAITPWGADASIGYCDFAYIRYGAGSYYPETELTGVESFSASPAFDEAGIAVINLRARQGYTELINATKGTEWKFVYNYDHVFFRGFVEDVKISGRYDIQLLLKQLPAYLQNEETLKDYDYFKDEIAGRSTTQIISTAAMGDGDYDSADDTYACCITPGSEPAFTNETVVSAASDTSGTLYGDVADVNNPDDNHLFTSDAGGQTATYIELTGTYSGTRANVVAIEAWLKLRTGKTTATEYTVKFQIYDYTNTQWDDMVDANGDASTITYVAIPVAWIGELNPAVKLEAVISSSATDYIKAADNEFKVRMLLVGVNSVKQMVYHFESEFYTVNVPTDGYFPVTSNTTDTLVVGNNPTASGVNVADFFAIGKVNYKVLEELVEEFRGFIADIDTALAGYTTSDFATQAVDNQSAINSVLSRDQGVWFYKDNEDKYYCKKLANLPSSSYDFGNTEKVKFHDITTRGGDIYQKVRVVGASYKVYETELTTEYTSIMSGSDGSLTKLHNDDQLNSQTETRLVSQNLAAKLKKNMEPTFLVEYNTMSPALYPGLLVAVTRDGETYSNIPIKRLTINWNGHNDWTQLIEVSWAGTPVHKLIPDKINELRKEIRRNAAGIALRSTGTVSGTVTGHSHLLASVTDITASPAELNKMDGVTASTEEINVLDGVDAFKDEDDMTSDSPTAICSQQSIKKYVDDQILTEDTIAEMNDTVITGPADNDLLQYDNGSSKWVDRSLAEAGLAAILHNMASHSDDDTYNILTSGTAGVGALSATGGTFTGDVNLPFSGAGMKFNTDDLEFDSDGASGYIKSASGVIFFIDGNEIYRVDSGGFKMKAYRLYLANGTTYYLDSDGDAVFKALVSAGLVSSELVYVNKTHNPAFSVKTDGGTTEYFRVDTVNKIASVRQGGYLRAYSAGDDKNISIHHNDTNAYIAVSSGSLRIGTDGGVTDYTQIAADGEITLHGTARVTRHLRVGAGSFNHGASAPAAAFEGVYPTIDFDAASDDEVHYTLLVPARWDSTTDVTFAVDWFYDGGQDNGTVTWAVEYKSIAPGEAVTGAGTTISKTSAGTHATGDMVRTEFTTKILAANLAEHDTFGIRLYRDVSEDTLAADARLLAGHFEFIENKLGKAT